MRRFTRLTNGFSKKLANLEHSVSLHFMHYNFARIHKTLRVRRRWPQGSASTFGLWKRLRTSPTRFCYR